MNVVVFCGYFGYDSTESWCPTEGHLDATVVIVIFQVGWDTNRYLIDTQLTYAFYYLNIEKQKIHFLVMDSY